MCQSKFQDSQIKNAFLAIAKQWRTFDSTFRLSVKFGNFDGQFQIDRRKLVEAVGNAFKDMERMAAWHMPKPDQRPDRHKYAAFLSRWIAKTRPIYLTGGKVLPLPPLELQMVNAYFAAFVFSNCLNAPLPIPLYKSMVYAYHFRDERGETLALLAYACEEMKK